MKNNAIWVYSPSLLSQISIPVALIIGMITGGWIASPFEMGKVATIIIAASFVILLPVVGFFLYGHVLVFNSVDRSISVKTFLCCFRLNQKIVAFADAQAITLTLDTEGFPRICLKLDDGKRYYFCTFSTRNDYVRICDMLGWHP